MQNIAQVLESCRLEKFSIPLLDAVEWGGDVGVQKTIPAADGRAKAILATIHIALTLAKVTVCLAQGLLLEEN
jgi:hypothetical protein